ncbi:ABC transporter permease [Butyrivibrio sp. MC2013]|uniref:ABC transporter permease n=1 Tax=Butyrivibrio sp. MC2013 TaxID=1280686 RepID=UPI00047B2FC1|nr:ABC transporter permease [Butyrivibrio sp. MC2013]
MKTYILLFKNRIQQPLTWVMTLMLIIAALMIYYLSLPGPMQRRVLIYDQGKYENGSDLPSSKYASLEMQDYSGLLIDKLLYMSKRSATVFDFEECSDPEELKEGVASGRADCGFILSEDFDRIISECEITELATLVTSSYSARSAVASETFLATVFEIAAQEYTLSMNEELFGRDDPELSELISGRFDQLLGSDEVFALDYKTVEGVEIERAGDDRVFPFEGLVMVMVTMAALAAGVSGEKGSAAFAARYMAPLRRRLFLLADRAAFVTLPAISGFVILMIAGFGEKGTGIAENGPVKLLLYMLMVIYLLIWSGFVTALFRSAAGITPWLPAFFIVQLILFFEQGPGAEYLSYLFPAGLYSRLLILF